MKKVLSMLTVLLLAGNVLLLAGCEKKVQTLYVYSIIHDEETKALTDLFTQQTGIPVSYVRATTGELVNRVISEKNDPQADILLGGASSYHMQASAAGALERYESPLAKRFPAYAKSSDGTWTGFCVLTLGIGINKTRFASKFPGVPYPSTWEDLLNPAFKGEVVMTDPVASSTAYLFLQDQLQRLGPEAGWEYLIKLSQNVGQFPDSGSAPPKLVGTGEYALGIAYLHALTKYNAQGFDIQLVAPPQSVGDVDAIAITKNAKHLAEAKKFVDFMLGKEAQELMSAIDFTIPVNPEATPVAGSIPIADIDLIDYDTEKASRERKAVLERWSKEVR
ncbi:MAG: ABC transporter substrate-binding protein [Treponema sp.]|nr:ABC transporter substrate-binding protein [Treponema sp.]